MDIDVNLSDMVEQDGVIKQAQELLTHLEAGNKEQASDILSSLTRLQEGFLFQELGKLTRDLHDTIRSVELDDTISSLAHNDLPDAKHRLDHVISMTQEAADTTLNSVEICLPLAQELGDEAAGLKGEWERFRNRELSVAEFRELSEKMQQFFEHTEVKSKELNTALNEVLMAQGFQDLTGQIIGKVISMVETLESSMVRVIKLSGGTSAAAVQKVEEDAEVLAGPQVPGLESETVVSGQDDVDDLLSSLGF